MSQSVQNEGLTALRIWGRAGMGLGGADLAQRGAVALRLMACAAIVASSLWALVAPAAAEEGRLTLTEENDGLLPDGLDRHYTQGALLTYLSPTLSPEDYPSALFNSLGGIAPVFPGGLGVKRKFDVVFGQSIFTPTQYHLAVPDPRDRPFAGWLYTGGSLLQETGGTSLENFEVLAGVVGPDALARQAQESFHSAAGYNNTNLDQGWSHQLKNEPGLMITYERKLKMWQTKFFGIETEVIPEGGLTVGNVMTYGQVGATFRIGQNLGVDYGPNRVRPSQSGAAWFDPTRLTQPFGWYLYAGVAGRAVAQNIFLDGNSFATSPSVHKNIFVGDFTAGASLFWADWVKVDFTFTERTKEFTTQKALDHFGGVNLAVRF